MAAAGPQITPTRFVPPADRPPVARFTVRPSLWAAGLALLVCAALAWFLLTARAVYLDVSPAHSTIDIRGGLKLKLADPYLLRTGDYELLIEAEGFHSLRLPLAVGNEQNQHYSFDLQPLPGHLRVDTTPLSGAQIFLDDVAEGASPAVVRDIPAGEHRLRVSADLYFPFEDSVLIEGRDREQTVSVTLVPAWADISFASEPAAADVLVNDELLGQTPLTTRMLQGTHAVRIKLPGFKPWQDQIDVTANVPMSFDDIRLDPADAVVLLISDPPQASVTVDGEYAGLTPLELALTPQRKATIRLFRQGYEPASRQLSVASGSKQDLRVRLVPELVTIEVDVSPPAAELFIDGKSYGAARQTLQLPAGTHRIELRHEGYVDYTTTITPYSGMAQQLKVKLKTQQQAHQEQIKPLITTHAGQTLKLLYPAGFSMGASRREPGRRANETLRNIQLTRPFYLGLHEVTNQQYRQFEKDHSSGMVQASSLDGERQPVVKITWEQAARYCNWLSKLDSLTPFYIENGQSISGFMPRADGYRLPTEAEWEWAARVSAAGPLLKFPWGQDMPPPKGSGNYADASAAGLVGRVIANYQDGYIATAPVGSFGAGNQGLFDMGGNVAEWVHDFYDIAVGQPGGTEIDPMGPERGEFHVIKGSSFAHGTLTELRLSYRDYDVKAREDVGFRLARYLE